MGKIIHMQNNKGTHDKNVMPSTGTPHNEILQNLVIGILEKGEKPTRDYITQEFEHVLQQYNTSPTAMEDMWDAISQIFSTQLSNDDIKLLANMYEDIGTHTFNHPEFSINFGQTHETSPELLDNTLDKITSLLDRKTVNQLMLWTQHDLFHNFSQNQAPKIHPLNSKYTRKKGTSQDWHKKAA